MSPSVGSSDNRDALDDADDVLFCLEGELCGLGAPRQARVAGFYLLVHPLSNSVRLYIGTEEGPRFGCEANQLRRSQQEAMIQFRSTTTSINLVTLSNNQDCLN